jgi:hypothetical protein
LITAAPLAAQDAALLPEPGVIANAVGFVAGFKSAEGITPKDGFYAHTGHRDLPDAYELFAGEPGAAIPRQPRFVHGDMAIAADTRDKPGHPSRGGLYRAAWVGFRDLEGGTFSFDRYEIEGAQFVPLWAGRTVLALHGWSVLSITAEGRQVPYYLLSSLGGHNTLRGYTDYRFHDRHERSSWIDF